jgi:hypothetical protein
MAFATALGVYRPSTGQWYTKLPGMMGDAMAVTQCGLNGDFPVPIAVHGHHHHGNHDGYVVFRPSNGTWYIKGHGDGDWTVTPGNVEVQCGLPGDIPVPRDYYGEGHSRLAVFRPSNGSWYIKGQGLASWSQCQGNVEIQCGLPGDIPVPADYYGEGRPRIAVFRPSNGTWYIKGQGLASWSQTQGNLEIQCGLPGDIPVPADYFGEGRVRLAVFRPSNGTWYIKGPGPANWSQTPGNVEIQCGLPGDVPLPFDYFGEGRPRLAVWRPSNGTWYVKGPGATNWDQTPGNVQHTFGLPGDLPMPSTPHSSSRIHGGIKAMTYLGARNGSPTY